MRLPYAVTNFVVAVVLTGVLIACADQKGDERMIQLPEPEKRGDVSLEKTIENRRSIREFKDKGLSRETVGQLLWAAQGITEKSTGFRAAPSAGATYPLETYVVADFGMFHYVPGKHAVEKLSEADRRKDLAQAALGQRWVARAPVNIVFAAVYERTTARYGERGRQYVHMEAGHAAENVLLQAVALDLGAVPIGAFRDQAVAEVLNLPDKQHPLYIIPVGVPAEE